MALLQTIPNTKIAAKAHWYQAGYRPEDDLCLCYTWGLSHHSPEGLCVCAVSYLNTVPLVWGMLHGSQRDLFELEFQLPSVCADRLASGAADIGIIPSFELARHDFEILSGSGIACHGPVRSILLVSSQPLPKITRLAVDSSSRTSVQLARVILRRRYGVVPELISHAPDLDAMLRIADAALIIGDPALRIDPARLPWTTYDLGAEWISITGSPMVFAVWAGRKGVATPEVVNAFNESCRYGREQLEQIVASEAPQRGFPAELVRDYLANHIVHELSTHDYEGMQLFLRYARELDAQPIGGQPRMIRTPSSAV